MTSFDGFLRAILEQAGHEARRDRSPRTEAQHVLLAMASQPDTETSRLLRALGLDHASLRAALDGEFRHSLDGAGVSTTPSGSPAASGIAQRAPDIGASVQQALERGLGAMSGAPRPAHVLLGILQAEVGTVPRALALAGFERGALIARVHQSLQTG